RSGPRCGWCSGHPFPSFESGDPLKAQPRSFPEADGRSVRFGSVLAVCSYSAAFFSRSAIVASTGTIFMTRCGVLCALIERKSGLLLSVPQIWDHRIPKPIGKPNRRVQNPDELRPSLRTGGWV